MSGVNLSDFAYTSAVDEYTDYVVYKKLADLGFEKRHKFSGTLKRLSGMEYGHYRFWSRYCPERKIGVSNLKVSTHNSHTLDAGSHVRRLSFLKETK